MVVVLLMAIQTAFAAGAKSPGNELSQDITVRAKSGGPTLAVPPPSASKPVIDEVLRSLTLTHGSSAPTGKIIRVTPSTTHLQEPFAQPPFLALSPQHIRAYYDSWTFEIRNDANEVVSQSDGVGVVRESIEWDGAGPDGRLELAPGRAYHYRFIGKSGKQQFIIESDPVMIKSFSRRQYGGETRLEVSIDEIFIDGRTALAPGADRYISLMVEALRNGEKREDGSYRFELYSSHVRGPLTKARVNALIRDVSAALHVDAVHVSVLPMPAERGEALAVFLPASKGARLHVE